MYGFDFGNSKERATRWLKKQNADIIAFQELKGYDSLSIKNMALQWNHPHVVLWNRPGAAQPLAITSKMPIKKIELLKEDTKDKGALIVKTNGIVFINVHLHPNNVKRRQQEAKAIITHAKALEKNGDRVVILGDFNAMSPYDKTYINGNLNTRLKNSIAKGKCADLVNSCKSWDFSVLQSFYDAQFEDVVASLLTNKSEMISKRVYGSFPSTLSKNINSYEEKSENLHRLDYVLVSNFKCKHTQVRLIWISLMS